MYDQAGSSVPIIFYDVIYTRELMYTLENFNNKVFTYIKF